MAKVQMLSGTHRDYESNLILKIKAVRRQIREICITGSTRVGIKYPVFCLFLPDFFLSAVRDRSCVRVCAGLLTSCEENLEVPWSLCAE